MLLPWHKPITIALTPENIAINSGGKEHETIVLQSPKSTWAVALAELEKNSSRFSARQIRFVLSNHYVRYAVLPWQSDVYSKRDYLSLAENHLRTLYGNLVDSWKVVVEPQGYGQPLLVSAIDLALLTRLELLAEQFKWTIEAIEPALMAVARQYHGKIKSNDWLMMVEAQRIVLVEMVNNRIVSFSVTASPESQKLIESGHLINRKLKLQEDDIPHTIHLLSEHALQPKIESKSIKLAQLAENREQATFASMLVEL